MNYYDFLRGGIFEYLINFPDGEPITHICRHTGTEQRTNYKYIKILLERDLIRFIYAKGCKLVFLTEKGQRVQLLLYQLKKTLLEEKEK